MTNNSFSMERPLNVCVKCHNFIINPESIDKIINIIVSLPPRYYLIILYRIIEKKDIGQIAKIYHCTRERIRQIEIKAYRGIISRAKIFGINITVDEIIKSIEKHKEILPGIKRKEVFVVDTPLNINNSYPTGIDNEYLFIANNDKSILSLDDLNLSLRSFNCLKYAGIDTIEKLINTSENDFLKIKNLGRKGLWEIKECCKLLDINIDIDPRKRIDPKHWNKYKDK